MSFKKFIGTETITEGTNDMFPDVDVLKLDPDRADITDVVDVLMPTLVRMAYVELVIAKKKYERTHTDEEDDPFEFTVDALEEKVGDIVSLLKDKLDDLNYRDFVGIINKIKSEFKEKIEDSK